MFKRFLTATVGLTVVFALPTQAADGTINFRGEIKDITCTVTADATVTLPTIRKTDLTSIGATAGDTPFNITLAGCNGSNAAGNGVAVHFEPGVTVNVDGRLNNTGTATNVQLAIYTEGSNTPFSLGARPISQYRTTSQANPHGITMPYTVKYFATSTTPGSGTVVSSVTYSVVYF
ncbi:fimbrial protein [Pseudomonas arsenicoxydans]|uniref:Type 1 fimbrial protein n=1 Tax=Pseudomonas arsenicoxydans TaxID=702115 RepID=A0A502I0P8_9PSED|nr:fimbrial protein [Pseudomonas arsenicoxydans]TPG79604.1 type 1 fimbrial protein [Pseudomonas arsenicoxydans]